MAGLLIVARLKLARSWFFEIMTSVWIEMSVWRPNHLYILCSFNLNSFGKIVGSLSLKLHLRLLQSFIYFRLFVGFRKLAMDYHLARSHRARRAMPRTGLAAFPPVTRASGPSPYQHFISLTTGLEVDVPPQNFGPPNQNAIVVGPHTYAQVLLNNLNPVDNPADLIPVQLDAPVNPIQEQVDLYAQVLLNNLNHVDNPADLLPVQMDAPVNPIQEQFGLPINPIQEQIDLHVNPIQELVEQIDLPVDPFHAFFPHILALVEAQDGPVEVLAPLVEPPPVNVENILLPNLISQLPDPILCAQRARPVLNPLVDPYYPIRFRGLPAEFPYPGPLAFGAVHPGAGMMDRVWGLQDAEEESEDDLEHAPEESEDDLEHAQEEPEVNVEHPQVEQEDA